MHDILRFEMGSVPRFLCFGHLQRVAVGCVEYPVRHWRQSCQLYLWGQSLRHCCSWYLWDPGHKLYQSRRSGVYFCHQFQYAVCQCTGSYRPRNPLSKVDCQDWRFLHSGGSAHFLHSVPHWIAGVLTSPRQRNCKRTHERTVLSAKPHPQNNFWKVKPASYWFHPQ